MRNCTLFFFKKALYLALIVIFPVIGEAQITITEMSALPMPISNNAVTMAENNGTKYLYSFGGIDSTKSSGGITLSSFRYNTSTNSWENIPDLPDTLGKIASGASTVKNKIYIIGGYHVFASGNEVSSNKVHVFDPELNTYLADATQIPVAIDDQVQDVWRDSIIFVITGWSNNTNVANVQLFNPSLNSWSAGTSVPNSNTYKAFGATGKIVGDTIYYIGGASTGANFPAQKTLKKGIIDPTDPSNITWSAPTTLENIYRGVATTDNNNNLYFLGGSAISYNYDGIAYNGSGGVPLRTTYLHTELGNLSNWGSDSILLPMDLRGIGEFSSTIKYLAGGMENNQKVSNKTLKIEMNPLSTLEAPINQSDFAIFPNPFENKIFIQNHSNTEVIKVELLNVLGREICRFENISLPLEVNELESGMYQFLIYTAKNTYIYKLYRM